MPKRTFQFIEGTTAKFWSIDLSAKSFTVNWGKLGATGQSQSKSFATSAEAVKQHDKLIAEKTGKGYKEIGATSIHAAPEKARPTGPESPEPAAPGPKVAALVAFAAEAYWLQFDVTFALPPTPGQESRSVKVRIETIPKKPGAAKSEFTLLPGDQTKKGPGRSIPDCMRLAADAWKEGTFDIKSFSFVDNQNYSEYPIPSDELEDLLLDAWREVLGPDRAAIMQQSWIEQDQREAPNREAWFAKLRRGTASKKWDEGIASRVGTNFRGVDLSQCKLDDMEWSHKTNFQNANFQSASLKGASFNGGRMQGANFKNASLERAGFSACNLKGADFTDANLSCAYLNNTYLSGAILKGANLSGADLEEADLRGVDLSEALLDGKTVLKDVRHDKTTHWPPGFPEETTPPVTMEIVPHVGVGPVKLGMTIKQVEAALRSFPKAWPGDSRKSHYYFFGSSFQIELDEAGKTQSISLSSSPALLKCLFEGKDVFDTPAPKLFKLLASKDKSRKHSYDAAEYFFPELALYVWEADTQYDRIQNDVRPIYGSLGIGDQAYKALMQAHQAKRDARKVQNE
jgi:predicted DNA-binding WGR domain protein